MKTKTLKQSTAYGRILKVLGPDGENWIGGDYATRDGFFCLVGAYGNVVMGLDHTVSFKAWDKPEAQIEHDGAFSVLCEVIKQQHATYGSDDIPSGNCLSIALRFNDDCYKARTLDPAYRNYRDPKSQTEAVARAFKPLRTALIEARKRAREQGL